MLSVKDLRVQYTTDHAGAKNAVILPLDTFNALLEDLDDLAVAAERREEATIFHEQLLTELKADGLLPD